MHFYVRYLPKGEKTYVENTRPLVSAWNANCPSRRVLDLIADKWTGLVIATLADGTKRYSQIHRQIEGVSHKMLSQTLRELEGKHLVTRTVYNTVPPQVEYALTPLGETLVPALRPLIQWAEAHAHEMERPAEMVA